MEALDGNAIAGLMMDAFGHEMTTATGICRTCGNDGPFATLRVYLRAPGAVARCPVCDSVIMVLVTRRQTICVDMRGLAA
jgi:hypothetical protein